MKWCIYSRTIQTNLSATYRYGWLTHWSRVTHICVSKLTVIGSDNGLSPDRRQAIIWTNGELLLIAPLGKKLRWNLNLNLNSHIFIQENSFECVVYETTAILSPPQCVKRQTYASLVTKRNKNTVTGAKYVTLCKYVCVLQWYHELKW